MDTRSGELVVLAQQGALLRRNLRKPISIESRRIAFERMITLDFSHCGAFFAEYSSNISMTGMFIRTDRIQPPGTIVELEFSLADGSSLINGQAEVIWVRERNESPDRPAGLGLRFVKLSKESRQLIRWAVEQRLRDSGSFELDESEEAPSTPADDLEAEKPSVGEIELAPPRGNDLSPGDERSPERDELESRLHSPTVAWAAETTGGRWWVAFAALAGLLVGALFYLYRGSEPGAVSTVEEAETASTAAPEAGPVSPRAESPQTGREIAALVAAWAEAWSMQRVDAYLAFYAESYRPAGGVSLARWREQRRSRISTPKRIEVGIADFEVRLLDAEHAQASFLQTYRSDRFGDSTRKTLDLVLEDGRWKIQSERSKD